MSPHFVQQWSTTLTNNLRFGGKIWVLTESQTYNKTLGFREKTWVLVKKNLSLGKKSGVFVVKKTGLLKKIWVLKKKDGFGKKKTGTKKIIENNKYNSK